MARLGLGLFSTDLTMVVAMVTIEDLASAG